MHPSRPVLWIGIRNDSSWSLRAWLALHTAMPVNMRARRRIEAGPEAGRDVECMIGPWCEAPEPA